MVIQTQFVDIYDFPKNYIMQLFNIYFNFLFSEDTWVFDPDVMWSGTGSGKKGYLLFNCQNLDNPLSEDSVAAKHSMTFKFSQVCLSFLT